MPFLDLKMVFDMVDHQIMLRKLRGVGMAESAVSWFMSHLSGRSQVTKVEGVSPDPLPVPCGVPQGSILGPRKFIVYVNDLPGCLNHSQNNTVCG